MTRAHDLRQLLAAHRPTDAREAGFVARMFALLDRGEASFLRDHYQPGHFTASAFVLSPDRGQLLLILHAKLGLWLQPGGHFEPSDGSALAAARREVSEEVGLTGLMPLGEELLDVDIHDIPASRDSPGHQHFDVRFLFAAATEIVHAASDAHAARWVDLYDSAALGSDESVLRAVGCIRQRFTPKAPTAIGQARTR